MQSYWAKLRETKVLIKEQMMMMQDMNFVSSVWWKLLCYETPQHLWDLDGT